MSQFLNCLLTNANLDMREWDLEGIIRHLVQCSQSVDLENISNDNEEKENNTSNMCLEKLNGLVLLNVSY